ncbi:MAG TPA: polysaccharide deacetylase family protein [Symbiobacteriaceae bacterium]|jgi:peptidoglycan/xylan/chitin deacetylase (PgdA/CDA1 family)
MRLVTRWGLIVLVFLLVAAAAPPKGGDSAVRGPKSLVAVRAVAEPVTPLGPPVPPRAEHILAKVPVLMYHEIGDKPNNNYVDQVEFEAQMRWLADHGYHGVTLGEVYRHFHQAAPLPPRPVAITFDDGYSTFYTIVVPTLQQHHFRATNFVITGQVGKHEFMTWDEVEQLPKLGMEVGAHTVHHPDLRMISEERLHEEVFGSKAALEAHLGIPVQFFCYPSGQHNNAVLAMVQAAGFLAGVTTAYGPATPEQDPLIMDRIRVLRTDTVDAFGVKVARASVEP